MKRYLVRVSLDQTPQIASALAAASISVVESPPDDNGTGPPRAKGMTLGVNAPSADEALEEVRQTLHRWGQIDAEVVGDEPL